MSEVQYNGTRGQATTAATAFDVIVAGGGMIGTAAALALAPLGLRIAVVEAVARAAPEQPSFDDRSTALSRSSQRLFAALGMWPSIAAAAAPVRHIHVSDRGRFGFSHLDAEQQRVEALGYVVVNRVLGAVLQSAAAGLPNVSIFCPARIVAVRPETDSIAAQLATGGESRSLDARLLVVADGARSSLRQLLGIGAREHAYAQHAIVGNLLPELPIRDTAYERFTAGGPLAMLPMADGRAAFVWTVADRDMSRVWDLGDEEFRSELQSAFGNRLGRFERVGERSRYPLFLSKALRVTGPRSVLVGNAAHGLHPVAAQGFNLGLRDVATLADCVADALRQAAGAAAIGAPWVLGRYADWRRTDQAKLVSFTDGLARLFAGGAHPRRALRDAGMLAFDLVPGVRAEFARHTMGLAGRLPRLSRGVVPR